MSRPAPSGLPARTSRRVAALISATAASVLLLGTAVLPAAAQPTSEPAAAAAGWLARQMVDGERFEVTFSGTVYPDHGLTADAALGFAAAGTADDAGAAATAWLGRSGTTTTYIGDDGAGESYAGPTAKLGLLAQVRGDDPTSFGEDGIDLIGRLEALEDPDGRFADQTPWGDDYSNSIGQSLAIIVLHRQPGTAPTAAAVDLLLQSQCDDGGFALELQPDPGDCVSGPDTTAFAVQALLAVGRTSEADAGLTHLEATQDGNGGFTAPDSGTANSNSTGTAGQALRAGGRSGAADAAVTFLEGLQQGCDAPEADRGGIAFDAGGFDAATAPRATAQALLAFSPVGLAELTNAGASAEAPVLDCPAEGGPEPTTTTTPPAPEAVDEGTGAPGPTATTTPGTAPPAVAVRAHPTFTG
jgi:hypothetical protein